MLRPMPNRAPTSHWGQREIDEIRALCSRILSIDGDSDLPDVILPIGPEIAQRRARKGRYCDVADAPIFEVCCWWAWCRPFVPHCVTGAGVAGSAPGRRPHCGQRE